MPRVIDTWERLSYEPFDLWRIEVPGGWLVYLDLPAADGIPSLTFYQDPGHLWERDGDNGKTAS